MLNFLSGATSVDDIGRICIVCVQTLEQGSLGGASSYRMSAISCDQMDRYSFPGLHTFSIKNKTQGPTKRQKYFIPTS